MRLDRFLAEHFAEGEEPLSRARLQRLIEAGSVRLNDAVSQRVATKLHGGEWIALEIPEPTPVVLVPEPIPLSILYEDGDMIVVDKPAGMVVHPGAGHATGTLVHALLHHVRDLSGISGELRPGIVHRLDKETSGVLVVAKHDRAHLNLARQFAERRIHKHYIAFVVGTPKAPAAIIDTGYGRHATDRVRFSGRVQSDRRAVTEYRVVAARHGISELAVTLHTGRTHQIRVHMSEMGCPVVGDALYGGTKYRKLGESILRPVVEELQRHALHAHTLQLSHPMSGALLRFEAPLPLELVALRG